MVRFIHTAALYLAFLAGCAAVVYGVWQWSEAAAWVVGGLLVAVLAVLTVRANMGAKT